MWLCKYDIPRIIDGLSVTQDQFIEAVILSFWCRVSIWLSICAAAVVSQGQEGPMRQWVFMQIQFALATVTADQWKGTCATCCDRWPKEEMTWVRAHLNGTYQDPTANRQWLSKQGYQSCEWGEGDTDTKYSKSNYYCYSNLITKNKTDNVGKKERQNMI